MKDDNQIAEAIEELAKSQRMCAERIASSIDALTKAVIKLGSVDDYKGAADILADAIERRGDSK